jgi:NTE family protein
LSISKIKKIFNFYKLEPAWGSVNSQNYHHFIPSIIYSTKRLLKEGKTMSFAMALAGGGSRGAAHVGVLLALEESGLNPHSIAGTSAGSIVAGLYATGTTPKMLKELIIQLSETGGYYLDLDILGILKAVPQFIISHKFDLTGLIKGNRLERLLKQMTNGKNMQDTNMRTIIPAVDINSGNTIAYTNSLANLRPIERVRWDNNILISEAIRASCAVPAVFQPKFIDGMCLVDGGVTDVLPVDLLLAAGESNVLAVDVSSNYKMPKNHNLIEISSHSLSIMSTRLKECHSCGEKLLLKPNLPEQAGLLTLENMVECMEAGYEAAHLHMSVIKALFS